MILADKIIRHRKKNGWSQEELAEKMNVSRQAVSKWESAQSVPDLEKILQLGELFGVTTDYLLKDTMEDEEYTETANPGVDSAIRRVTLAEANAFLAQRKSASVRIAAGVFLCMIAVIPLLLLGALTEMSSFGISESLAAGIGLCALFVTVAAAVVLFIVCGFKNAPYAFLDTDPFETEYGVTGMVQEKQKAYRNTYIKGNIIGTCLCILAPLPLLMGAFTENAFLVICMLIVTLLLAGIGVVLFIVVGVRFASMQKLLKEGEYTPEKKKKSRVRESVSTVYWLGAVAVYLGWSLAADSWHISWIVWPIAGVLFAVVTIICNLVLDWE